VPLDDEPLVAEEEDDDDWAPACALNIMTNASNTPDHPWQIMRIACSYSVLR
jgi:hypothetical protein